jgi:hypothetical protein
MRMLSSLLPYAFFNHLKQFELCLAARIILKPRASARKRELRFLHSSTNFVRADDPVIPLFCSQGDNVQDCQVCANPRHPSVSTSQIEWHNLGHPGLADGRQLDPRKLRAVVIIRPGDQILYEIKQGIWCRVDELDVAIAAGHRVNDKSATCARCFRHVLERRRGPLGFWGSLKERIALKTLRRPA